MLAKERGDPERLAISLARRPAERGDLHPRRATAPKENRTSYPAPQEYEQNPDQERSGDGFEDVADLVEQLTDLTYKSVE
jgi:hypothetical protein